MYEGKIEGPDGEGRRAADRDSLFLCATIRRKSDGDDELQPVRVRNLSKVGMMADYSDLISEGDQVVVSVRGIGTVGGKVAWVKAGRIGVAFDHEVDPKMARRPIGRGA